MTTARVSTVAETTCSATIRPDTIAGSIVKGFCCHVEISKQSILKAGFYDFVMNFPPKFALLVHFFLSYFQTQLHNGDFPSAYCSNTLQTLLRLFCEIFFSLEFRRVGSSHFRDSNLHASTFMNFERFYRLEIELFTYLHHLMSTPHRRAIIHNIVYRSLLLITVAETSPSSARVVWEVIISAGSASPSDSSTYIDKLLRRGSRNVPVADAIAEDGDVIA